MLENNSFGDPLLDSLMDLAGFYDRQEETVMIVDLEKQKALSTAYDILLSIQRSTGAEENVEVKYHYSAGCATVSASVPGLYLNAPWLLAFVFAKASNVQMIPAGEKIRISIYFSDYFRKVQ